MNIDTEGIKGLTAILKDGSEYLVSELNISMEYAMLLVDESNDGDGSLMVARKFLFVEIKEFFI